MTSPRINVSLDPRVYDAISRVALGTRVSRSALGAEIVSANVDLLSQLADVIEELNMLDTAVRASLEPDLLRAEVATDEAVSHARERLDELQEGIRGELSKLGIRRSSIRASHEVDESAGGREPPPINKGARIHTNKGTK